MINIWITDSTKMSLGLAFWLDSSQLIGGLFSIFITLLIFFCKARERLIIVHYCAFYKAQTNNYVPTWRSVSLLSAPVSFCANNNTSLQSCLTHQPLHNANMDVPLAAAPARLPSLLSQSWMDLHGLFVHWLTHSHRMESSLILS